MTNTLKILAAALLVALAGTASAGESTPFADRLFNEEDYFRAIGEYKRVLFFSTDVSTQARATLRIGRAYLGAKRPSEAAVWLARQGSALASPETRHWAAWLRSVGELQAGRNDEALAHLPPAVPELSGSADARGRVSILAHTRAGRIGEAREAANTWHNIRAVEMARYLKERSELGAPSPVVAGLLSAVVPGAGHAYAGFAGDGVYTFLLNAAFAGGTYYLVRTHSNAGAAVVGGVGVLFYLGNIYGGVNAAQRKKADRQEETATHVQAATLPGPPDGREWGLAAPW